jgi:hypothetical protein
VSYTAKVQKKMIAPDAGSQKWYLASIFLVSKDRLSGKVGPAHAGARVSWQKPFTASLQHSITV